MNGAEHYVAAETLLPIAQQLMDATQDELAMPVLVKALVHATLAGTYAHNRAQTELMGLLQTTLDQIREAREAREVTP